MILARDTQNRAAGCPDHQLLRDFLFGLLSREASPAIARHIDQCQTCAAALSTLDDSADEVLVALREPGAVEPFSEADSQRVVELVARLLDKADPVAAAADPLSRYRSESDLGRVGDYELLSRLGEGGMGAVFRARHRHLDKIVALKLISPERAGGQRAVARFQREMRAIGRLEHPNIVGAHDAGEADGVWYLAMEYIDGVDLSALVRSVGHLAVPDACELMRQAACGLQHAHEHGLVHRDIKPSNLMLSRTGQLKLLDLGLAMLHVDPSPDELTAVSAAMGTADYMAPEQAGSSCDVDIRADLYSLGCTLYRLLAGRVPFPSPTYDTPLKKAWAHARAPALRLRNFRLDVSANLESVIARMMAKYPEARYQTPAAVVEAIAPFASGYDFSPLIASATHSDYLPTDLLNRSEFTTRRSVNPLPSPRGEQTAPAKRWSMAAAAGCLLVLLIATAGWSIRNGSSQQPHSPEARLLAEAETRKPEAKAGDSPRRRVAEFVLRIGGSLKLLKDDRIFDVDKLDKLPPMPFSVRMVNLAHNEQLTNSDLAKLGDLCRLRSLDLNHTALADSGLKSLHKLTMLANLNISGTHITDAGLVQLAKKTRLQRLSLATTAVTDAGIVHLLGLKQLEAFDLGETQITDAALEQLDELTELTELGLFGTKITDRGLFRVRALKNLRLLCVNNTQVGDAGAKHIATLQNLANLSLRHTRLTDSGLEELERLSDLSDLDVSNTGITAAGVQHFRRALPNCRIRCGSD